MKEYIDNLEISSLLLFAEFSFEFFWEISLLQEKSQDKFEIDNYKEFWIIPLVDWVSTNWFSFLEKIIFVCGFLIIIDLVIGWEEISEVSFLIIVWIFSSVDFSWGSLTVIGLTLGWVLVKTFIVEYPTSKEFLMSFLSSGLVVLLELFIGWPNNKSFEVPIDSWFGKSIGFDRSVGESGRSISAGFIWIDFDRSMDSENLWEDVWVVWGRSIDRSKSSCIEVVWDRSMDFDLDWAGSTRSIVVS